MNRLQSTSDFMLGASQDLLAHSQKRRDTQAFSTIIEEPIGVDKKR